MRLIYRVVSELFLIISPLIIIYRILKGKENLFRSTERYAIPSKKRLPGKLIWFHCSSVGELLSIIPLIEKLESNSNINQILITTTTLSSSKIFEKYNFKKTVHQFFPIDNNFIIKKFINYWKPSVLFLCESEIWPNLINTINKKKINLILLNGRMTYRSFKKWKKIDSYSRDIFQKFDYCFSQNKETFKRLKLLGAKKIYNIGNLKFTTSKKVKAQFLNKKTNNFFKKKRILITAASTHNDEENFIIENHLYFKKQKKTKNIISIIAPRHIERVNEIKKYIENASLKTHLYSSKQKIDNNVDIFIVDTYGELNKFYKISNIVFMGGSLIKHGGQNPLEPSKFGCKIIHGPNIDNFTEIYKKLNKMKISNVFSNYKEGIKIIEKSLYKKRLIFDNKKIMKYGAKILNTTYFEIIKFI
tara:strand:- start:769 stop:2019 length:1251 start_codon:yes stop_codon:yes gene_type:complete